MPKKSAIRAHHSQETAIFALLWNEVQAAAFIGMSVPFLRAGRAHGVVGRRTPSPPYIRLGRAIRYDKKDLEAWVARHRTDPDANSR